MSILWLSRHQMTEQQHRALPVDGPVFTHNVTFSADGKIAAYEIMALADRESATYSAGVFPAHVAIYLSRMMPGQVLIPVSVPAPAKEGETRAFIFDHWEVF